MSDQKYEKKIMCKRCQQETWHSIINNLEKRESNDTEDIWIISNFITLKCMGCDNVCLLIQEVCSEDIDPRTGEPDTLENIYPNPFKSDRDLVKGYYNIPGNVKTVYEETITAFNKGLLILSAIGLRTVIEAISLNQKIKARGIKAKIEKMVERNIITNDNAVLLMLVKDIGNLATHEIKKHHKDDLTLCIEITEGIIQNLYIHPKKAKLIRELIEGGWERA